MGLTKILSAFFLIVAIGLAFFLGYRIKYKIDDDKRIERQEKMVINKLKLIRDAEVAYLSVNRKYTGDFDTLINFIDTGHIYMTQRNEEIITKQYGAEEVIVTIDTIGKVSVKDSVLTVRELFKALAKGTISAIKVSQGGLVKKGDVVAVIKTDRGKKLKLKSLVNAKVDTVFVSVGTEVEPSTSLALMSYKRIGNLNELPLVPMSKKRAKFELWAGKITKGNVVVDVFEARDTDPVDLGRRRNNNENALKVGSRTDVSISGNWE
jgi:hypothetical protein